VSPRCQKDREVYFFMVAWVEGDKKTVVQRTTKWSLADEHGTTHFLSVNSTKMILCFYGGLGRALEQLWL
jgi:hypothetical protein